MNLYRKVYFLVFVCTLLQVQTISSNEEWVVNDIRISGLQRVSAGSVFNVMPIAVGDTVDVYDLQTTAKTIFKTGQFDDIQLGREGNTLIISLVERPSIASIELDGNKALKTEDLLRGLDDAGLSQGQVFKRSIVNSLALEIQRQYVSQGRYGARVDVTTEDELRNRVSLNIEIDEGEVAEINSINIIGNKSFVDEELLKDFELKTGGWFSFFTNDNRYSREKLKGDIESLESFYKNRGYVEFNLESSQVSVSSDKSQVFITLNISEGTTYNVGEVKIVGDLPIDEDVLKSLVLIKEGQRFNQYLITETEEIFKNILGNEGYSFAEVRGVPDTDEESDNVDLTFYVDAQQRTYVRRIIFKGNKRTHDVVLRREMRQMEGAWASNNLIENSKIRLERLGFFKEVESETVPVAGVNDQIDVEFSVEEEFSGSIGGSLGYGAYGLVLGLNYNENNAFGTGRAIGIGINDSTWQRSYSFSYGEPYFNIDGVSRGYSAYFRESDYGQFNIASYTSDSFGAGIQFGLPISDIERFGLNFNYDNTSIDTGSTPASQILAFTQSEGTRFEVFKTQLIWSKITLNRGLFPTAGQSQSLALQVAIPGSSLTYTKATYRHKYFKPIFNGKFVLGFRGEVGLLEAYGDTNVAPFFEHYYSGGISSVRGFKQNTLGPRAIPSQYYLDNEGNTILDDDGNPLLNPYSYYRDDRSIGGAYLIEGGFDFIFKLPFIDDQRSMRSSFFIDIGNVFSKDCGTDVTNINCSELDLGELRYSYGVGVTWITQLGPMSLALAAPSNEGPLDETEKLPIRNWNTILNVLKATKILNKTVEFTDWLFKGKNYEIFKTILISIMAVLFATTTYSADLNIATLDPQAALFSTNVAKKELEELENSEEWKEVVEELQAKATEAREIQEKTQKDGPTMSDEDKQEAAQKFQSLQQDINFLREKTNQFRNQTLQLISQEQAEKFQVIVTELIRAKGITLLINSGGQQGTLLHADQSFDITQEVIDAMNEKED